MLPALGQITAENQGEAINWIEMLIQEGRDVRQAALEQMNDCMVTYDLGVDTAEPDDPALVNDSQNAVIAAVDTQTREATDPTVVPVEQGEGGPAFWVGPAAMLERLGVPPQPFTQWSYGPDGQMNPPQPIPEEMALQLQQSGQDRYLCTVDDAEVAKFCTTVGKLAWNRSQTNRWLRRNILQNNVKGWQFVWALHDNRRRLNSYRNVPNAQVYCDLAEDVGQMAWMVIDDIMAKDEALKYFHDLSDEIQRLAVTGVVDPLPGGGWSRFVGRFYYRPVVPIRMTWLRDQAIPMTHQEALDAGAVVQAKRQVIVTPPAPVMPPEPENVADVASEPVGEPAGENATMASTPVMPQIIEEDIPGQYALPDGTPVAPGDELWPANFGIREIVQIGREIVADRQCADWDIPVALNQNIPVLGTPYGYGEPHRVKGLQKSKNRLLQSIVDYSDFYRFPPALISQSMKAALGGVDCITPGVILTCPDQMFMQLGGRANVFMDLPQLPPAAAEFLPAISNELDKQSQNAPVLQGYAPGANMSGEAINSLQQSASALISYKAKTSSDMCYRLAMLSLHRIMSTITPQEAHQMVSRLPIHVEAEIIARYHRSHYDVEIEVQAGTSSAKAQKREQVDADQKACRISLQSAREDLNIDHWKETQRIENEQRTAMALQAQMRPAAPVPQPPPQ